MPSTARNSASRSHSRLLALSAASAILCAAGPLSTAFVGPVVRLAAVPSSRVARRAEESAGDLGFDVDLVRSTWAMAVPEPSEDVLFTVGNLLFDNIFEMEPGATALFPFMAQDNAKEGPLYKKHVMGVVAAVDGAVKGLDDVDALIPVLKGLGNRHGGYGVIAEHYQLVGSAFLKTLEMALQDKWTPEVKEAWLGVWSVVSASMKAGADEPVRELKPAA